MALGLYLLHVDGREHFVDHVAKEEEEHSGRNASQYNKGQSEFRSHFR